MINENMKLTVETVTEAQIEAGTRQAHKERAQMFRDVFLRLGAFFGALSSSGAPVRSTPQTTRTVAC